MKKKNPGGTGGRDVVARLSPHRLYALLKAGRLLIASVVLLAGGMKFFPPLALAAIATAFAAWLRYMRLILTEYTLTEETLSVRTGIVARKFHSLELYRVRDYIVSQSVSERIIGLMTATFMTSDSTHPEMALEGIPKSDIVEAIRELVQKARRRNRVLEM